MNASFLANQYKKVKTETDLSGADPHKLIALLYDGALENLKRASGGIKEDNMEAKARFLNKALAIVEYLRVSLDPGADLEFSDRLAELYRYMEREMLNASINNSPETLEHIASLIVELKEGWNGIPEEYRS